MTLWLFLTLIFSVFKVRGVDLKPFFLMLRVKPGKFSRFLEKFSSRGSKVWMMVFDVGVAMGFGMMGFALYFLVLNIVNHFLAPRQFVAVVPPIPGVVFPLEVLPHFVVALAFTALVHEVAHAIASKVLGVRVRSVGVALFIFIFSAFVELEDEDVKKISSRDKLRIFAAGSFSNMLFFLILIVAFTSLFQPGGVMVQEVRQGTPAEGAGLTRFCVIKTLNETTIPSVADLHRFMGGTEPNQSVVIEFIDPNGKWVKLNVRVAAHPFNATIGFLGIIPVDYQELKFGNLPPRVLVQIHILYYWTLIVLFSIAVFNMLPIAIFDGGRMLSVLAEKLFKGDLEKVKKLSLILSSVSAALIIFNILLTVKI